LQGLATALQHMTLHTHDRQGTAAVDRFGGLQNNNAASPSAVMARGAGSSTPGGLAGSSTGLILRQGSRSRSPTSGRQEVAATTASSIAATQQQLRQRGHAIELQQQQQQQGLHHSRSDAAINMLPDSAGPECGPDGAKGGPGHWDHEHDTYLKLEVCVLSHRFRSQCVDMLPLIAS
jgi:hypothetical protein